MCENNDVKQDCQCGVNCDCSAKSCPSDEVNYDETDDSVTAYAFKDPGQLTREQLKEKLYNLNKRLVEVNSDKKAMAKDYNDQLKEIKSEIKETLAELDQIQVQ